MQATREFISVHSSQLCHSDRKIPIWMQFPFVYKNVIWAIHRPKLVEFIFNIHLIIHILLVEIQMATNFPKISFCHMWGIQKFISMLKMNFLPWIFNQVPYHGTFWMPEYKSSTSIILQVPKADQDESLSTKKGIEAWKYLDNLVIRPEKSTAKLKNHLNINTTCITV